MDSSCSPLAWKHGLTSMQLRRMAALGLPIPLICAAWAWGGDMGITGDRDLDGIEYFSGCKSLSDACRGAGMNMCALPWLH